jgi:pyridoxine 4-dehydrogenase
MPERNDMVAAAGTITIGGDLIVNRLGFGAMRITGKNTLGDPPDRGAAIAVVRRALELGINFIDTADSYGPHVSERLIAEALYPYPDGLVIATKGGLLRTGAPGPWPADGRPEHLREACEGSLRRLRLDRIDLYQLHRPDPNVPLEESLGALVELKNEGKIRHIGVSNVDAEQLRRARHVTEVVSVQNRYSAFDRRSDALVDLCEREGLAFLPWAPLERADFSSSTLTGIAARHDAAPAQVMIAWLLARSPAILTIPGTGSVTHLEENVGAAELKLSDNELNELGGADLRAA